MTNFPTCKIQRWIPTEWVESTNPSVDMGVVSDIFRNFSFETFGALPGIFVDRKFRITDGNHRLRAARIRGHKYIPIIILTEEEYDHIAFSKNVIDFMVFRSDFTFETYPAKICTKLPLV